MTNTLAAPGTDKDLRKENGLPLVTFCVVAYKQPLEELKKVVGSILLYTGEKVIYIVDNSPGDEAAALAGLSPEIRYLHQDANLGSCRGNNVGFREALEAGSTVHFVVNPDICFTTDVVTPIVTYMLSHPDVGEMMPKILSPDGTAQYLPKLVTSPGMQLQRRAHRLFPSRYKKWMWRFEMRGMRDDRVYEVGHISGCFSAIRTDALRQCGLFDERFFMYFEDNDFSRRVGSRYKALYFPFVEVTHEYGHGASKKLRLFCIFVVSMVKYFNKWGWIFDRERRERNRRYLAQTQE